MDKSGECGDLIMHPRVSAKLEEVDVLRKKLSALIEEHESLIYGQRDLLMAKYNRDLGYLEHELFLLDVELAELRRRISILQVDINRGRAVTTERLARLDEEIHKEFEKFHAEVKEKERELHRSVGLLETGEWMKPEDVTRTEAPVPPDLPALPSRRWQGKSGAREADLVYVAARLSHGRP